MVMFNYLDDTLKKLLDSAPPNPIAGLDDKFIDAEISFETPKRSKVDELKQTNTVNLFLYEG